MTKFTIQNVTNQKLLELNKRKKQKINWIENNYDTARVMNQEIVDERKENQWTKIWQKKINSLLHLDSELFTSKSSIQKWAVVSAQQTKMWNREINDLLRLDFELFTSISMTASFRQKKKKQLIVKLRVRQLKQKQKQKQLIVKLVTKRVEMK